MTDQNPYSQNNEDPTDPHHSEKPSDDNPYKANAQDPVIQTTWSSQSSSTNPLSITSLVCGVLCWLLSLMGLVCCVFSIFGLALDIAAIACGHIALNQIKRQESTNSSSKTMAIVGLVLGYLFLAMFLIGLVIGGIFFFFYASAMNDIMN